MGQRHQAFLIARVIANRGDTISEYRCVGALHHQWCRRRSPLTAAYRFIQLASQDDNGAIIRDELRRYADLCLLNPERPCDYVTSLCKEAFDLLIDECSGSGCVSEHPANIGSTTGDNNDGITVLDISDLRNISLCFVNIWELEGETKDPPRCIPLTPEQYLRTYYPLVKEDYSYDNPPDPGEEAKNLDILAKLKDTPIVSLASLAETWPGEYRYAPPKRKATHALPDHETRRVASLAELSLDWAMTHAIKENQLDLLTCVLRLPGKANIIFDCIKSLEALPSSAIHLLNAHLKASPAYLKDVDLSGFVLTGPQVLQVLGNPQYVERLNVSGNTAFDNAGLCNMLRCAPELRWLNITNTAVTREELEGALEAHPELFYHIETILHPFFYEHSDQPYPPRSSCNFWYSADNRTYGSFKRRNTISSLPLLSTDVLVQNMLDFGHFSDEHEDYARRMVPTGNEVGCIGRVAIHSSGIRPRESKTWEAFPTRNIPFRARSMGPKEYSRSRFIFVLWQKPSSAGGRIQWRYGILVKCGRSGPSNEPKEFSWETILQEYKRLVDVPTFLELLRQEGRSPPSDLVKLQEVYDIFSQSNFQLASLESLQENVQVEGGRMTLSLDS